MSADNQPLSTVIRCRAKISEHCMDGTSCMTVYGRPNQLEDGLWDEKTDTVICDACYVMAGAPSVAYPASRVEVVAHVNKVMGIG